MCFTSENTTKQVHVTEQWPLDTPLKRSVNATDNAFTTGIHDFLFKFIRIQFKSTCQINPFRNQCYLNPAHYRVPRIGGVSFDTYESKICYHVYVLGRLFCLQFSMPIIRITFIYFSDAK